MKVLIWLAAGVALILIGYHNGKSALRKKNVKLTISHYFHKRRKDDAS